jgi:hypothetical protein
VSSLVSHSLKAAAQSFRSLSEGVAFNPWLLIWICTNGHCGDDVVDALINEAGDGCVKLLNVIG